MRVLQVHNRHRIRGGEDEVVEDERRLLVDAGHVVDAFLVDNPAGLVASAATTLRAPWNRRAAAAVVAAARAYKADVVHVHNTWFALSPAVFEHLSASGCPVVATLHNFRTSCVNGLLLRGGRPCEDCVGRQPWPAVVHRCYRGSLSLSAVAASTIEVTRRRATWDRCGATYLVLDEGAVPTLVAGGVPAERIVVRPNFVPDPGPRSDTPSSSSEILYIGRLSDEKGIAVLMDAWRRLGRADLRLSVFGDGPLRARLEARRVSGVTFHGSAERSRITSVMLGARALVYPSICREAGPRAPIEAAAAGLPVVVSDAVGAGAGIVASAAGWSVPAGDPDGLARVLETLDDTERVDTAGSCARARYEQHHSPGPALRSLEEAYESAIARARTSRRRAPSAVTVLDRPR